MNFNGSAGSTTTTADVAGGTLGNGGVRDPITDGTNGTPRTGTETRVSSMGVTRCIYYVSQPQVLITQAVTAEWDGGTTHINTVTSKSGNYTATYKDETIVFTASATLSLPPAAGVPGKKYTVIGSGSSTVVTIDPNSSETVCLRSTIGVLGNDDSVEIQSDGTNWKCLSSNLVTLSATVINVDSTPTLSNTLRNWIGTPNRTATGTVDLPITSGAFSSLLLCSCNIPGIQFARWCNASGNASTITAYISNGGSATNHNFQLTCTGFR